MVPGKVLLKVRIFFLLTTIEFMEYTMVLIPYQGGGTIQIQTYNSLMGRFSLKWI